MGDAFLEKFYPHSKDETVALTARGAVAEGMWKQSTRAAVGGGVLFAGDRSELSASVGSVCITSSPAGARLSRATAPASKTMDIPFPAGVWSIFDQINLSPWIWRWQAFQLPAAQGAAPTLHA